MTEVTQQPVERPNARAHRPRGGGAPAARFEPGRVAEPRPRNPIWLVAGVLLVVVSALGGVLLFSSTDDRMDVVVAATEILPGQPVERADLRVARVAVDDGIATVTPEAAANLVGQQAIGRVPAGTLLSPGMFADELPLKPGEVVFGAALDPGEAPLSGLQIGTPVELLNVVAADPSSPVPPPVGGEGEAAAPASDGRVVSIPIGPGIVWAVEPIATGQLWVSIRVDREVGLEASLASAQDSLRIVLVGSAE